MSHYSTGKAINQDAWRAVYYPSEWILDGRPKELKDGNLAWIVCAVNSLVQKGSACHMSNDYIAKVTGASIATIKRDLIKLKELGYIDMRKPTKDEQGCRRILVSTKNIYGVSSIDLFISYHDTYVDKNGNAARGKDPSRFEEDPMED